MTSMLQLGGVDTGRLEKMVRMHPGRVLLFSENTVYGHAGHGKREGKAESASMGVQVTA